MISTLPNAEMKTEIYAGDASRATQPRAFQAVRRAYSECPGLLQHNYLHREGIYIKLQHFSQSEGGESSLGRFSALLSYMDSSSYRQ